MFVLETEANPGSQSGAKSSREPAEPHGGTEQPAALLTYEQLNDILQRMSVQKRATGCKRSERSFTVHSFPQQKKLRAAGNVSPGKCSALQERNMPAAKRLLAHSRRGRLNGRHGYGSRISSFLLLKSAVLLIFPPDPFHINSSYNSDQDRQMITLVVRKKEYSILRKTLPK